MNLLFVRNYEFDNDEMRDKVMIMGPKWKIQIKKRKKLINFKTFYR